jgi:hypothetical protein
MMLMKSSNVSRNLKFLRISTLMNLIWKLLNMRESWQVVHQMQLRRRGQMRGGMVLQNKCGFSISRSLKAGQNGIEYSLYMD